MFLKFQWAAVLNGCISGQNNLCGSIDRLKETLTIYVEIRKVHMNSLSKTMLLFKIQKKA